MARRRLGRSLLGIAFVLGVFVAIFTVCGAFRLVLDHGLFFGSRSGSVLSPPLANEHRLSLRYASNSREDSVYLYVPADGSVVVDYALSVESGSMSFVVFGPYSFVQRHVLAALGPKVQLQHLKTLRASGAGQLVLPVAGEGYFQVKADAFRLTGTLEATIAVR